MRIIAIKTLKVFWKKHPDVEQPLRSWHAEVKHAEWKSPNEVKAQYKSASVVGKNRIVFNIAGNKYRVIVAINYHYPQGI